MTTHRDPTHDPAPERDDEAYRESTFVARPGETVRASAIVREEVVVTGGSDADDLAADDLDTDEKTELIRAEIEETRLEMSQTVDAIQEKLNPSTLADQAREQAKDLAEHAKDQAKETVREIADQAKEAVREATIGKAEHVVSNAGHTAQSFSSTLVETIKENPIPAALTALSLGWLFKNRSSSHASSSYGYQGATGTYPYGRTGGTYPYGSTSGAYPGSAYGYADRPAGYYRAEGGSQEGITDKVGDAVEQVRDAAGNVVSTAGEKVGDLASGAGHMAGNVGGTARSAGSSIADLIAENPIPAALTGLGLAWLFMNRSSGHSGSSYDYDRSAQYPYSGTRGVYRGSTYGYPGYTPAYTPSSHYQESDSSGGMKDKVGDTVGQVRDAAGNVVSTAGEKVGDAVEQVRDTAGQVASTAGHMAGNVGGTARDTGSSIVDLITANPIPAALTGLGLAWLFTSRSSDGDRPMYAHSNRHRWQGNEAYDYGYSSSHESRQGGMSQVADRAQGMAGQAVDHVQDTAGSLAGGVQHRAGAARGWMQELIDDNPLMAGAMAAAVGMAVGFAAPETPQEHRVLGQARDRLMEQAKDTAQETMQKVQQVAGEAQSAVKQAAQEQNLMPQGGQSSPPQPVEPSLSF